VVLDYLINLFHQADGFGLQRWGLVLTANLALFPSLHGAIAT
jgi:hypothetical protein